MATKEQTIADAEVPTHGVRLLKAVFSKKGSSIRLQAAQCNLLIVLLVYSSYTFRPRNATP